MKSEEVEEKSKRNDDEFVGLKKKNNMKGGSRGR